MVMHLHGLRISRKLRDSQTLSLPFDMLESTPMITNFTLYILLRSFKNSSDLKLVVKTTERFKFSHTILSLSFKICQSHQSLLIAHWVGERILTSTFR